MLAGAGTPRAGDGNDADARVGDDVAFQYGGW